MTTASSAAPAATVTRFMDALNRQDTDAIMAEMTDDPVFEHVAPSDKGFGRHEGNLAVRAAWDGLPGALPGYHFEIDDIFATDDRCTTRWTVSFDHPEAGPVKARGVDVFLLRDGKIAEKLSYFTM